MRATRRKKGGQDIERSWKLMAVDILCIIAGVMQASGGITAAEKAF